MTEGVPDVEAIDKKLDALNHSIDEFYLLTMSIIIFCNISYLESCHHGNDLKNLTFSSSSHASGLCIHGSWRCQIQEYGEHPHQESPGHVCVCHLADFFLQAWKRPFFNPTLLMSLSLFHHINFHCKLNIWPSCGWNIGSKHMWASDTQDLLRICFWSPFAYEVQ